MSETSTSQRSVEPDTSQRSVGPGTSQRSVVPGPHPGLLVGGRYELVALLASGGMAEVWEAVDRVLERPVAVKLLHQHLASDRAFTARFRAEAIAAARLHHHSIVAIYDTCHDDGLEAIVMELVRGRTLRAYLDERGRLDPIEVVHIGADVAEALAVAHRAGIIHRDVKPANILLCDDERVMVTDFGIAKVRDSADLTTDGTMVGTAKYLSPEQVAGRPVDARSDLYALGVVLYESLLGQPPFNGDTAAATALARLHRLPPRPRAIRPEVPAAIDEALMRALATDPADRFADGMELRTALLAPRLLPTPGPDPTTITAAPASATVDPTATVARPVVPGPQTHRPAARTDRTAWLVPLLLLVLMGGSVAVAAALLARTEAGDDLFERVQDATEPTEAAPVVVAVEPFDPLGDDDENAALAALAVDGDGSTRWRTETYQSAAFSNLKEGVGLVVRLERPAELDTLRVDTATPGWQARVYVADGPTAGLESWGEPIGTLDVRSGTASLDLRNSAGDAVLIWITRLPEDTNRVEISELRVTA